MLCFKHLLPTLGLRERERERESKSLHNFVKSFFSVMFFLVLFSFIHSSVYATDYYVAGDTGNDTTGNGSIGTPWQTIQKAAGTALAPGDVVNVKGGLSYAETVTPSTSGTLGGDYITYQAWSGTGIPIVEGTGKSYGFNISSKSYLIISGFTFKNQTFSGISILSGSNISIINNVFSNTTLKVGTIYANLGPGSVNFLVLNNTIYDAGGINFQYFGGVGTRSVQIKNNVIIGSNASDYGIVISNVGITTDSNYNLVWNNTTNYFGLSAGANDVSSNPLFVDSSNSDFHLQNSSPAIGAGADLSASGVTTDILGVARPQGSAYDIGAYEYYDIPVTLTTTPTTPSSNTTPTIAGTASTIGAGSISSISYSVDSGSWVSTGVTGTTSFSIVVPALADGAHTVRVRATDSYGNITDSTLYGSTTFTVDTTAPSTPEIDSPSGFTKDNTRPSLVYKTVSSVSSYSVSLDSGKNKSYSTSGIPSSGTGVWKDDNDVKIEFQSDSKVSVYFKGLNSSELTEGKHTWKVTAYDSAGNSSSTTTDILLDRTASKLSELAIADVSIITLGSEYTLDITNRTPSFSGKAEDSSRGSEKTNDNGTKDTFEAVSSGIDIVTLTIKKLEKGIYIDHLTQDYSLSADRFYITTPYPLVDGYYQVTLAIKDKAGNTDSSMVFYMRLNYKGSTSVKTTIPATVTKATPVNRIKETVTEALDTVKEKITQMISPSASPTTSETNQQPSAIQSFFSWVTNLFKSIFHK